MYSFTPNGRRRGLHAVVIVDLTASVLLWTSATAGGSYGWIFQLAGVVLAVLGIYLITRYSLPLLYLLRAGQRTGRFCRQPRL